MGLLSLFNYYKRRPSRQILSTTRYSINREYSAIDFTFPESNVISEIEKETDLQNYYLSSVIKKWIAIIVLGFFIGTLGAVQILLIDEMNIFKNGVLRKSLQKSLIGSSIIWIFWTVLPIMLCSILLVIIEPTLKGCGIVSTTAYLNGVRIKRFHKASTLWILYLSIFLISAANMPGGREELFIHAGALSGAFIARTRIPFTKISPFLSISDPLTRRTLVAAGTAAGVTVSFGTPIGAVLFCLEEGLSFWTTELTYLMFLCAICSNFVLHLTYTLYGRRKGITHGLMYYLFFSEVDHIPHTFTFAEIPIFILMGVIGGLLGSLWNEAQILLCRLRKRYIKKKYQRILEVVLLGFDISICSILAFHLFGAECNRELNTTSRISSSSHMKVYCKKDDEFESVGIFLFQDLRHAIKSLVLVNKELISTSVLVFGGLYYYVFSQLQLGTYLPSGILVPQLLCGAVWGYLVGIWYSGASVENMVIAKYAFLGALAQGSGTARLTLSLGVIMIESSGQQVFSIPIFIIVVTAKWFGGIFSRPIYRIETYLEGFPFLRATCLPISSPYKAKHIMITPMTFVTLKMTVRQLVDALKTAHQIFPVIENEKVVGVITKYQIAFILKTKIYNLQGSIIKRNIMYEMMVEYQGESFIELEEVIHSEDSIPDADNLVDITNYINTSTYLINKEMSLKKIYTMFVALGLTYVIVIDDTFKALGIITRKDIACFRKRSQFMLMRTEILPLSHSKCWDRKLPFYLKTTHIIPCSSHQVIIRRSSVVVALKVLLLYGILFYCVLELKTAWLSKL